MGTSASGGGAGGGNPLIPDWIDQEGLPAGPDAPQPIPQEPQVDDAGNEDQMNNGQPNDTQVQQPNVQQQPQQNFDLSKRFTQPRTNFNKYVSSGGKNSGALRQALKGYSRNAAGGTQRMARRMKASTARVARFYSVIDEMKTKGKQVTLQEFNLTSYQNKPILDILSALTDLIFADTGRIYEKTQDDSIAKQAYSDTVIRISELEGIDLDNLTNEQVEVMMAIFIEETIAHRVINDIGNNLTEKNNDISELVRMEEGIYQIVKGLVRIQIMPELIATNRGDKNNLEQKIENIYRIAFDAMAGINN